MAKIIILNAPPGAGKDTIGKMISFYSPGEQCRIISFKEPMFDIALAILGKENYQRFMLAYDYIRINPYYQKNGYSEHDYKLVDKQPNVTVKEIIRDHLNSTNC